MKTQKRKDQKRRVKKSASRLLNPGKLKRLREKYDKLYATGEDEMCDANRDDGAAGDESGARVREKSTRSVVLSVLEDALGDSGDDNSDGSDSDDDNTLVCNTNISVINGEADKPRNGTVAAPASMGASIPRVGSRGSAADGVRERPRTLLGKIAAASRVPLWLCANAVFTTVVGRYIGGSGFYHDSQFGGVVRELVETLKNRYVFPVSDLFGADSLSTAPLSTVDSQSNFQTTDNGASFFDGTANISLCGDAAAAATFDANRISFIRNYLGVTESSL